MRPTFHPRLVNGPFDDPSLYIPFAFENRALLFDIGDLHALSARDILKISHAFVSHTHVDHFFGFDTLLRLLLGRDKTLFLFGPEGFLENVEGKLAGYTWNLVERYANRFEIVASEITEDLVTTVRYPCNRAFARTGPVETAPFTGVLVSEPALTVTAAVFDHAIPCLGFAVKERFHVNIIKDALPPLGLSPGPWINRFKSGLFEGMPPDSEFTVNPEAGDREQRSFTFGDLARRIARVTPGQKVAYITDIADSPDNVEKAVELVRGADRLFIEAAFLEADKDAAREKHHLTAAQAGRIAAMAEVKEVAFFHHSPRYEDRLREIEQEGREAFAGKKNGQDVD